MLDSTEVLKKLYFQMASTYYLSARFLVLQTSLAPLVCGNLFHHAIEMYLKGHLSLTRSEDNLKKTLGHHLGKIWQEFKKDVADSTLERFDQTIATLHQLEDIRYPNSIPKTAPNICVIFDKPTSPLPSGNPPKLLEYQIVVPDLDALVAVIFEKADRNPLDFVNSLPDTARMYLTELNDANIWEK
jgi:hypothetical protein